MTLDLNEFAPRIRARGDNWTDLDVEVTFKPISSGLSKNSTAAEFVSREWLVSVVIWESGELEFDAGRISDVWVVLKHHDLDAMSELERVLDDVVALVRDGHSPADALTYWQ
jgi:hypothetical protein